MNTFKNIIFDLGGVLLDIDFKKSQQAFSKLGIDDFEQMVTPFNGNNLFNELEIGLDTSLFYKRFRELTQKNLTDDQIEEAWCALLIGFRKKSIEQLLHLKQKYNTYLLSNTNEIHLQRFHQMFRKDFNNKELDDCFDTAYYSHRIQMRKPNAEAWLHIINRHSLVAEETIFIDDGTENIKAAKELGLQTIQLLPGMYIEGLEW
jgi:glucose-1-phosphatase